MSLHDSETNEVRRVVAKLGGQTRAAEFFGIRQPAVWQWIAAGRLPRARRRHLMDLHPEWFEPQHDNESTHDEQAAA